MWTHFVYHELILTTEGLKYSDQDKHPPEWRQELTIGICIDQVELSPFGTEGDLHEKHWELILPLQFAKYL